MRRNKRRMALLAAGLMTVMTLSCVLLRHYHTQLNREFDQLVMQNLTAYAQSQSREVKALLEEVQGALNAIASMVESSKIDPEGSELTRYLEEISRRQSKYAINYVSLKELGANLGASGSLQTDEEVYQQLREGETVVSQVRQSKRLGDDYYFSIAVPVRQHGQVVGALRSLLEGRVLVKTNQTDYFYEAIRSEVVKSDGSYVNVRKEDAGREGNLLDELSAGISDAPGLQALRQALGKEESATLRLPLDGGGSMFLSLSGLGYNGWHIVNMTSAKNVTQYAQRIAGYSLKTSVALALLVGLAGCAFLVFLSRQGERLDLERKRYAMLANFSDTVLFEYDYLLDTLRFTSNALRMLPLEQLRYERLMEKGNLPLLDGEQREIVLRLIQHAPPPGQEQSLELRIQGRERWIWCGCRCRAVYSRQGAPQLLMGKLVDITKQKQREEGLILRSETDPLTGLANKAAVEARIRQRLESADAAGYLMMVDLDDFKRINDDNGHAAGDAALARLGLTLRSVLQENDLAGRVGGDEFVAWLDHAQDRQAVERKARLLMERIAAPGEAGAAGLSCSVGAAAYPEDGEDFATLFTAADRAMYQAKMQGKHTVRFAQE